MNKPNKEIILLLAATLAGVAAAATFPNADGSGELSSAAAWGNPEWFSKVSPYGNATEPLQVGVGSFTVKEDLKFAQLVVGLGASQTAVIDCTTGEKRPKISVVGMGCHANRNMTVWEFKGGDWDFGGGALDYMTQYGTDRKIVLSSGAIVTNVANLQFHKTNISGNKLVLTGSSEFYCKGTCVLAAIGNNTSIQVQDGSRFYHEAANEKSYFAAGSDKTSSVSYTLGNNGIVVSNAWADIGSGCDYVGMNGAVGGLFSVSDGGYLHIAGSLHFGQRSDAAGQCVNSLVRADSGGVLVTESVYMPYRAVPGDLDASNRFEVLAGSICTNRNLFTLQHRGNDVIVSNGTMEVMNGFSGSGANNRLVLRGDRPQVNVRYSTRTGMVFGGDSVIRFELPPNGYRNEAAPVYVEKEFQLNDAATVELAGVEAALKAAEEAGVRMRTYTLVHALRGLTISDEAIAAVQAKLPEGCRFYKANDAVGIYLRLEIKPKTGLMLIFR